MFDNRLGRRGVLISVFVKQLLVQLRVHICHMTVSLVNKYKYTGGGFISAVLPWDEERKKKKRKEDRSERKNLVKVIYVRTFWQRLRKSK